MQRFLIVTALLCLLAAPVAASPIDDLAGWSSALWEGVSTAFSEIVASVLGDGSEGVDASGEDPPQSEFGGAIINNG